MIDLNDVPKDVQVLPSSAMWVSASRLVYIIKQMGFFGP